MSRLPVPGSDDGTWGDVLNDFLSQAHNSDGSLKASALSAAGAAQIAGDLGGMSTAPTVAKLQGTALNSTNPGNGQVLAYSSAASACVPSTVSSTTVSDATTSSKGIVQLAGDLAGTATSPAVARINGVSLPGTAPTSGQVLTATGSSSAAWSAPNIPVSSVAGKTGAVSLVENDVANLTSDLAAKVDKSTLTTKGDLYVASAAGTVTRLPAGTNGQFLQADSTQASGLGWTSATDTIHVSGLAGDGVTDDGPAIQTVLNNLGVTGNHSYEVMVEAPPTGVIYINSTVQIQSDNVTLRFGSPLLYGALGRIRIQGEMAETPASNKPVLSSAAAAGDTTITLNNTVPFSVGSYIVIRGARDATGNPLDNQKEYHTVTALTATSLTLNEPLENAYATFNANPGAPASFGHSTEITRAISSGITSAANRGDRTVTVSDSSVFTAGDYVQILDDSHTVDPSGADETTNFKHHEVAEVKQIVSSTQVRLSHALYHTYNLAKNARIAKLNPVKHATIRDANVTWSTMSTVSNAFEIRNGVQCQLVNCQVAGDYAKTKSWRNQAFRLTDSYLCETANCYATDPANTSSGSGYGATLYGATQCIVRGCRFSSNRHSVLFFTGAAGNLVTDCISEDVCLSDYDFHGAECVDNLVTDCIAIGGDSAATDGSTQKSACKVGNTTHTDGDHHNVFSNMQIINYLGAAFEVVPQSSDNTFRNSRVTGAYTGIKLVSNSSNTNLITTNTFVENVDFADISVGLTNVSGGASSIVQGLTIENCRFIRSTTGLAPTNASKVRLYRNSFYDSSIPTGTYAISGNAITNFSAKSNDLSGCARGVKLTACPGARVCGNILHDLAETTVFEDAGGNTSALFARNEVYGFTPIISTTGSGPSTGVTVSLENLYQVDTPLRHGYVEWNYDPVIGGTGTAPTSGTIYVMKVSAQSGGSVSNIVLTITSSAGVSLTAGQNFAALYDSTGARVGVTADQSGTWTSNGLKTMAFTGGPFTIRAGSDYYVALLSNGATTASFMRSGTNLTAPNANQANALQRFSTNGTGTSLPSNLTLSSNTGTGAATFWVALS
jgi:hypothetical protein